MRRLWLLTLGLGLTASAQAQTGPGVIHYTPNTSSLYRIAGAPGSVPVQVSNIPAGGVYGTTDLAYGEPGRERHRYFYDVDLGTYTDWSGSGDFKSGDHYMWDGVAGAGTQVTAFRGSRYITGTSTNSPRWSNDRRDSFFSFAVHDLVAQQVYLVRASVTGAEIAASTPEAPYQPLTESDLDPANPAARLQIVAALPRYMSHYWHPQGTGLYIADTRISGGDKLRFHPVGAASIDSDPIVFDESVTKIRISVADVSPATGQLVLQASTQGRSSYGDPAGLIVLNPNNPPPNNWNWLVTETTTKTGLETIRSTRVSPDGTGVAFQADRTSNGKVVAKGFYRIPLVGGSPWTAIREESATSTTIGGHIRWTW